MGIGAAWNEDETRAHGMPFPSAGERLKMPAVSQNRFRSRASRFGSVGRVKK